MNLRKLSLAKDAVDATVITLFPLLSSDIGWARIENFMSKGPMSQYICIYSVAKFDDGPAG